MKAKLYAFLTHLVLSAFVAAFSAAMVFFGWYPIPLDKATGVTDIYLILLSVDIVIGPIMTFVVYRPKKPRLKMDLGIIVVLQLAALSYGMNTVFQGRPVFIVFNQDRFDVVRNVDIDAKSLQKAKSEGNQAALAGWFKPLWVGAVDSKDPKRSQEILLSAAAGGADWPQLPELYVPLEQVKPQILKKGRDIQDLHKLVTKNPEDEALLEGLDRAGTRWLPLRGKVKDMVVIVDAKTAELITIVDINPWQQ